ncbi:MAG: NTP transferase domain-containing protein [Desulfomonile tiedjei]|nr:NTP transferase domain-containing protein [Desulfomonile tiedjei]
MTTLKGLIAAAGHGTRLHPLSVAVPKELLPIGVRPAVDYQVRDLLEHGIREIVVVINREKIRMRDYLTRVFPEAVFRFVFQDPPVGLGFAMLEAQDLLENDPFLMLLPDNVFFGRESLSRTLIDGYSHCRTSCVPLFHDGRYKPGAKIGMEIRANSEGLPRIAQTHPLGQVPSDRKVYFGPAAWFFTPEIFDHLTISANTYDTFGGDFSERPAVEGLMRSGGLTGIWVEGDCFDIGTPQGYIDCLRFFLSQEDASLPVAARP